MAGILDSKTRIMDVILTSVGKRKLAINKFRPVFASFSDKSVFYEPNIGSGSLDSTELINFEAVTLPADRIVMQYDDSGKLIGSPNPRIEVLGVGILSQSNTGATNLATGNDFVDAANQIVTGSFTKLSSHGILTSYSTQKSLNNSLNFDISHKEIDFTVNNLIPFGQSPINKVDYLDGCEIILFDKKLNHQPNHKFLHPIRKDGKPLGVYSSLDQYEPKNFKEVMSDVGTLPTDESDDQFDGLDRSIFGPLEYAYVNAVETMTAKVEKPRRTVKFENTTESNNIMCQFFEVDSDSENIGIAKLNIIDYGTFIDNTDKNRPEKHVFYVGKVYNNSAGITVYANLFTIVFD